MAILQPLLGIPARMDVFNMRLEMAEPTQFGAFRPTSGLFLAFLVAMGRLSRLGPESITGQMHRR
jgi:hypothetical protein